MASLVEQLENQRALIVKSIFPEVHPLLRGPDYWSGLGWHVNFRSTHGSYRDFLTSKEEHLGTSEYSIMIISSCRGIPVVIKLIRQNPGINQAAFLDGARGLAQVEHRHLILILGSFLERDAGVGLIMYPVAVCNLEKLLDEVNSRAENALQHNLLLERVRALNLETDSSPRSTVSRYLQRSYGCVSNALEYLHSRGIIHGELTPHHILLTPEGPCITDFGHLKPLSMPVKPQAYLYYAPEYNGTPPTFAGDIFSLGCCFLEICTVVADFPLSELRELAKTNWRSEKVSYKNNLNNLQNWITGLQSQQCESEMEFDELDLIELMLRREPDRRPDASKIVFYIECLEGEDAAPTAGCLYHQRCCRPRKFEIAENKKLQKEIENFKRAEAVHRLQNQSYGDVGRMLEERDIKGKGPASDQRPSRDSAPPQLAKFDRQPLIPRKSSDSRSLRNLNHPPSLRSGDFKRKSEDFRTLQEFGSPRDSRTIPISDFERTPSPVRSARWDRNSRSSKEFRTHDGPTARESMSRRDDYKMQSRQSSSSPEGLPSGHENSSYNLEPPDLPSAGRIQTPDSRQNYYDKFGRALNPNYERESSRFQEPGYSEGIRAPRDVRSSQDLKFKEGATPQQAPPANANLEFESPSRWEPRLNPIQRQCTDKYRHVQGTEGPKGLQPFEQASQATTSTYRDDYRPSQDWKQLGNVSQGQNHGPTPHPKPPRVPEDFLDANAQANLSQQEIPRREQSHERLRPVDPAIATSNPELLAAEMASQPVHVPSPYNAPEPTFFVCPFATCSMPTISEDEFYDHLSEEHKYTLSKSHRYRCSRCQQLPPMTLDALKSHLSQHTSIEQIALFNKAVYMVLELVDPLLKRKGIQMGSIGNKFVVIA